ncbi:protein C1orf43 homolog [Gigantopelta aegis]|uniref:protein C1orf43 homolog n=1 Tax=Gigantopelta aegis TaxID=1735272 RepID=UPI001B88E365|nr:protein C1orf43 homolog [Gigantopelta aegis]
MAELGLVSVVLFIATGGLVFILLFLFAKRQITRFTLKSATRPHINIGSDAPKTLRQEIQRRLDCVEFINHDPALLTEMIQPIASSVPNHYYYRMKALDAYSNAIECLLEADDAMNSKLPSQTLRQYLFSLCPSAIVGPATLSNTIHLFSDVYEQARHDPSIFGEEKLIVYMELLDKIIRMIKQDSGNRTSPSIKVTTDTEVVFRVGKKGLDDATVSVQVAKYPLISTIECNDPSMMIARPRLRHGLRDDSVEQTGFVDSVKSSGYSSTERSSSSRGSVEKLIPLDASLLKKDPD